jgi:hypothetical protein
VISPVRCTPLSSFFSVLLSVSVVTVFAFASCASTPRPIGVGVESHSSVDLSVKSPLEIAVVPIVNEAGKDVPTSKLRASFQRALVGRRYSPLALEFVDKHVTDASYSPGASDEQAVLEIKVLHWDMSQLDARQVVTAHIQVRLIDAAGGADLWTGKVDQRFEFGSDMDGLTTDAARTQAICERIAGDMLENLPVRNPRPGAN